MRFELSNHFQCPIETCAWIYKINFHCYFLHVVEKPNLYFIDASIKNKLPSTNASQFFFIECENIHLKKCL